VSFATLGGHRVTRARVELPAWGIAHAFAALDAEVVLEGVQVLELGGLRLSGVVRGGPNKGASQYRLVGGRGGWGKPIKPNAWANDAGVKLSTVLVDTARAAGEVLDASTIPPRTVGPAFTREGGTGTTAARVLELLVPESWHVGEDGVTRIGRRPRVAYTGAGTRGELDLARGVLELAADEIATLVPGVVIDELEAFDVVHELDAAKLRTTLYGRGLGETSRRLAAYRKLVAQLLPDLRFRGVTEYRVVTQEGDRVNLQPVRVSLGMPSLRRVPMRAGVAGAYAELELGSRVLVTFVNGDPGRPVIVGFEEHGAGGFVPERLELGRGRGRVLREGDQVMLQGVQANPSPTGTAAAVVLAVTTNSSTPPVPLGSPLAVPLLEPSKVFA
jgi:hypothetical protein